MVKIDKKIVGYEIKKDEAPQIESVTAPLKERSDTLSGKTYKIKGAAMKHSFYVTINDAPKGVPFEIFISSQDTEHFQWIASLTRMMSSVFRRAEDIEFMVEELKAVVDPAGGLGFMKLVGMTKPKHIASIPAAIGYVLEYHIRKPKKREEKVEEVSADVGYPESATMCKECKEKAVVILDGCATCLSCSDSKCG